MIEVIVLSALSIIGLNRSVHMLVETFSGKALDEIIKGALSGHDWKDTLFVLSKPLILCQLCMSSVWGTFFYFTYTFFLGGGALGWAPSIFAIAGVVYVLTKRR